ncbi:RNA polymerase [Sea otter poxvirus]|uniref:DNA-directed RNA polymerase 147 kDa polypeptide n=1 Tax=Sea otter poxvirus TaxID=1416741 RepID=A0A2U9QHN9_9POXV|nr:RNA polymerase [Sea otter poxvirus]AWU47114.1 RNA polymerase [Sea otter poxvirus]
MAVISRVSYSLYTQSEINATNILISHIKNDDEIGTIKDPRLGASDGALCRTCGRTELECFGHWGKVRLYESYIVRPEYIYEVVRILNHLCIRCGLMRSRDPYTIEDIHTLSSHSLRKLKDKVLSKKKLCWNNKCMQPYQKIAFSKKRICFINKVDDVPVPNALIYQKLTSIHRRFWSLLEIYQDPATLFYRGAFPVPPLIIRPSVNFWVDSVPKETNELSYLLGIIVKHCNNNAEEHIIQKAVIEYDNIKLISNNATSINLSYITSGKQNMIRSYIVARRKDETARSVIGPDPKLSINSVGVPSYIMNTLTEKIFVNMFTIDTVKRLFENNEIKFYFNKRLKQLTRIKSGKFIRNKIHLLAGDWVEISMRENTSIIFGRQPSLHKYNVIASSVKTAAGFTITIPPGIANSQNADFDGDEQWLMLEQNPKSVIEQSILMYPTTILKHDIHGAAVFGSIQDEIVAAYSLYKEQMLSSFEVSNILGKYGLSFTYDKDTYNGKEIFEYLISAKISFPGVLDDGKLTIDVMDNNFVVSMRQLSLAGLIADYSSNIEGAQFIDKLSYVLKRYLTIYGFSVTFRDLIPNSQFIDHLHALNIDKLEIIKTAYKRYLDDVESKKILPMLENDEADAIETLFSNLTNLNINEINTYMQETIQINPDNNLLKMAQAGYKVNSTELMYILGMYGQQRVNGEIPETRVLGRILPYYYPYSKDPEGRGYIINSLMQGLTGSQYYYAMLVARYQSTDIVCETSRTGTLARKVIKKMEDIIVDGYGQVVYGNVLLKYAANYTKIAGQHCKPIELIFPHESLTWYLEISSLWNEIRRGFIYSQRQKLIRKTLAPFNFLVFAVPAKDDEIPISSKDLYDTIQNVIEDIRETYYFNICDIKFIEYVLLTHLNPSRIKITHKTIEIIIKKLYEKLNYTLGGGTPIGIIAAQVLSEKFTQHALSSFHTTEKSGGVMRKLGFNEFNNLTNLSKNKAEIITLISDDIDKLQTLKTNFEFVCLGELLPDITIQNDTEHYTITITINRLYIKRLGLTELIVEYMLDRFISFNVLVREWGMDMDIDDEHTIKFIIYINFVEPHIYNMNKFMMILPGAVSKGKISKFKIPISTFNSYYDFDKTKKMYRISVELMGLKELGNFDLENVNVIPGVWNTYEVFGIEASQSYLCEALLSTYGDGFNYLYKACDLLSSLLCSSYEPESVNKFKFWSTSALKRATFGDNKALLNAALHKKSEPVNDNSSCHFFSKVPKIGTGYYTYYMDLALLSRLQRKLSTKVADKKIEELEIQAEDF